MARRTVLVNSELIRVRGAAVTPPPPFKIENYYRPTNNIGLRVLKQISPPSVSLKNVLPNLLVTTGVGW